ncbi:MAG TPA: glycoside hydrolase family 99-like domain-containing protein [Nitrospirales bacterium]|nr:glycoside hydrolase family 99-like domain-containing protein [Nitrospirales bacterium]
MSDVTEQPKLPWTGERYVPGIIGDIELEHLHRYYLARELAVGKDVLDIASGEGYGSALLAEVAHTVVGVDASEEVIRYAIERYQRSNVQFKQGVCRHIPLPDASVDLIVSFETIEHHDEHHEMMREFVRVLRPDGLIIISSPDKAEYSDKPQFANAFHVKELYFEEFKELLLNYFGHAQFYGQRVRYGSCIGTLNNAPTPPANFRLSQGRAHKFLSIPEPVYFVAIAANRELPVLPTGIFVPEVPEYWHQHTALQAGIEERDQQLGYLQGQLLAKEQELLRATAEHARVLEDRDQRFESLYTRLLTKEEELRKVHSSLLWRNISKVRILRERLCPEGSRRGQVCAKLVHWLKTSGRSGTSKGKSTGGSLERILVVAKSMVPVSSHRKHQLVSFVFSRFGSFFQQTESYRRWKDMQLAPLKEPGNPDCPTQDPPLRMPPLIQLDWGGMATLVQSFNFSDVEQPLVSIVIPVYNHLEYTVCCLASLLRYVPQCSFEVIIVDDGSHDETPNILTKIKNIRYCRNEANIGFLRSCNRGASLARGQYLLLLNNDTQVLEGWLDELVNTFQEQSDVGLVGSKLLYPNGKLQEAGAIIRRDGSAELVGLNGDPESPEYNVVREVDYCSGACLLMKAEVFKTLGGFDDIYAPAYCEDSDLAFRVRKMGMRVFYQPRSVVVHHLSVSTNDSSHEKMPLVARNVNTFVQRWTDELKKLNEVRTIAFFLPQYHPIPENDRWWGKGFTEWTNVTKARPNFKGHYQPHLPADLGFYDLRMPEVREEQARLARQYGISAFCYYYYWFAGKKLLNRPLDEVLQSGAPDFPFCLCWANENWTRRWDGCEEDILIAQSHTEADHAGFIAEIAPALMDPRYVRIHGKPLVIVYRLGQLPEPRRTADLWREYCVNAGIGEIYLAYVQSFERMPMGDDPDLYGFDAAIEFPPHRYPVQTELSQPLINPEYQGVLFDYVRTSENFIRRTWPSYKLFKGVMPSWDNTARRQDVSHVFVGATPERYEYWLRRVVDQTRRLHFGDERVVFINAWNEWAEGNHLEPDREFGHQYLVATKNALG